MKKGGDDEWDARGPICPSVFFDGSLFRMWYSAYDKSRPAIQRIGLAISRDGIHWDKHPSNPLISEGEPGSWDDHGVRTYSVTFNGSNFDMWYTGTNRVRWEIGHATSDDGVHWLKSFDNPVIKSGELGEKNSWMIHSPEVIYQDSVYRMWYYGSDHFRNQYNYATTSTNESRSLDIATIMKLQRVFRVEMFYARMEYVKVDSLADILPELSGKALIDAYNMLALAYSLNDETKSLNYARRALELATQENYPEGKAMALYCKANCQYGLDNYSEGLTNQLAALHLYDSLDMLHAKGSILSLIAHIHFSAGSPDLACNYMKQALEAFEPLNDTILLLYPLSFLEYIYLNQGDTTNAIKTVKRKLDLAIKSNNIRSQGNCYNSLIPCYTGHYLDSAIYYFKKAENIWDSLGSAILEYTYHLIAQAYFAAGPEYYDKAEEYYLKDYNRNWYVNDPGEVSLLNEMAELYLCTGRYNQCREFLDVSLKTCQLFQVRLNHQMHSYFEFKLRNEWELKSSIGKIYHLYFRLDTALKDDAQALQHYMLATQYNDSIYDEQERRQWAMLQGQYETESAQSKISNQQPVSRQPIHPPYCRR